MWNEQNTRAPIAATRYRALPRENTLVRPQLADRAVIASLQVQNRALILLPECKGGKTLAPAEKTVHVAFRGV